MSRFITLVVWMIAVGGCAERGEPTFGFTELAFPGAASTVAAGINAAGHVVGSYRQADRTYGYIYKDGTYTSIEYPGAVLTQLYGISADGHVVGSYRKPDETQPAYHGFLRTNSGEFLDVSYPGHKYSMAQRILPDGTVLGCYHDDDPATTMRGMTIPREAITASGVTTSAITVVDAPASMNNGGTPDGTTIVGMLMDSGQAYIIERGTLKTFGVPNAETTVAWDISPSGVIVGVFDDSASVSHGYVLENGRFTTIDFPGATSTVTFGINARGDIVGGFTGQDGQRWGYLATRK